MLGLFALAASFAHGQVLIDFEDIPDGAQPSNFLAAYGIASVTCVGGTGFSVHDYSNEDYIVVPSGAKVFLPSGGAYPEPRDYFTTTLTFTAPVSYFSFSKIAERIIGAHTEITYGIAGWRAQAFDAVGGLVDTEGIGLTSGLDFPSPAPNAVFTLAGSHDISSVVFTVNYNWMSTSASVGIDNFEFAPAVPEPAMSAALAAVAALAGAWVIRWRSRGGSARTAAA